MSERLDHSLLVWHEGRFHDEFWTIYRGWQVYVYRVPFGWRWSATRSEAGMGDMTDDRQSAEAAAFAAVDRSRFW